VNPDWTIAIDDMMLGWQHCTLCGRQGAGRCGIWQTGTVVVAYVLCHLCRREDGEVRLQALLEGRYGG
jgi:hypothetical protein